MIISKPWVLKHYFSFHVGAVINCWLGYLSLLSPCFTGSLESVFCYRWFWFLLTDSCSSARSDGCQHAGLGAKCSQQRRHKLIWRASQASTQYILRSSPCSPKVKPTSTKSCWGKRKQRCDDLDQLITYEQWATSSAGFYLGIKSGVMLGHKNWPEKSICW